MSLLSRLFGGAKRDEGRLERLPGGQFKAYHLDRFPIPDGHCLYFERLDLPIHASQKRACLRFCRGRAPHLSLAPEPSNPHHHNAIRVIGEWTGLSGAKREHIGYVERDIADRIARSGLASVIAPRLLKTYVGTEDFVEITYQIVGPKDRYADLLETSSSTRDLAAAAKLRGDLDSEIGALMALVSEAEASAKDYGSAPAPSAYRRLATVFRKQRSYDREVEILERYVSWLRPPEREGNALVKRLEKAQALLQKAASRTRQP